MTTPRPAPVRTPPGAWVFALLLACLASPRQSAAKKPEPTFVLPEPDPAPAPRRRKRRVNIEELYGAARRRDEEAAALLRFLEPPALPSVF